MAIYELIEWQVVPGKVDDILKLEKPWQAYIRSIGGKPVAGFTTAVGDAGRLVALIAFDDFAQFAKAAEAGQQNPELQRIVQAAAGMYTESKSSLLLPTPGSPLQ